MGWTSIALPLTRRALPAPGVVDLWLTDLDDLPLEAGPSGLTRRERVLKRRIQQQFVLRLLLGSYLKCPGKDVGIVRGERGKPRLAAPLDRSGLQFNLSHSGGWLAIAVARDLEVGLDIEGERQLKRVADLAQRYFSEAEAEWIAGLDGAAQTQAFLAQWTAREALVKSTGTGLAGALGHITLEWQPARIRTLPSDWPPAADWSLLSPDMPADLTASLAAPHPNLQLNQYFLQPAR